MKPILAKNAIGVFDSGVGGLSVLREIRAKMPNVPVIYFADQAHVPYGPRALQEVKKYSDRITKFLISMGVKIVVVACNTASAAALHDLRDKYPEYYFVGMEPAVKPAAETTNTGAVGVLATPATFQGKLYSSVVERFAINVKIYQSTCPGLVQEIEKGNFKGKETKEILEKSLSPMLAQKIDKVVLGCTHYPFVIPTIKEIVGPDVEVIDPAPAVARQTRRVAERTSILREHQENKAPVYIITSGDIVQLKNLLPLFIDEFPDVFSAVWTKDDNLNLTQL